MKTGKMEPTVFGPSIKKDDSHIYANDLKGLSVGDRVRAFRARMQRFFIEQVDLFAPPRQPADFPLAIMTCVGVEAIAAFKFGDKRRRRTKPKKPATRHFQEFIEEMDPEFKEVAPAPDGTGRPLSDFIFEGFRHSLVHGFYGKWVCITNSNTEADSWFYDPNEKSLVLNVYWFYRRFRELYDNYFESLSECSDPDAEPLKTFKATFEQIFERWLK